MIINKKKKKIENARNRFSDIYEIITNNKFKFAVTIVLFSIVSLYLFLNVVIDYNYSSYREKIIPYISLCDMTDEITVDTEIVQTFITDLDEIDGIYLRTATYKRKNDSYLNITILSAEDVLLKEESFSVKDAKDNDFTYFQFQSPLNVDGTKILKCKISSEDNKGNNGITLYKSTIDSYTDGELKINGISSDGDCFLDLAGKQKNSKLPCFLYISVSICLVFFIILVSFIVNSNIKLEYLFLMISGTIGILYIFIIPPYTEHDGEAHFNTIYKYSNVLLGYNVSDNECSIEKDEKDIFGETFKYPAAKGNYYSISKMLKTENTSTSQKYTVSEIDLALQNFPIVYVFSIIGLTVGRILELNIIYIYLITRLFNFMAYIMLTFLAIKIIPIYKRTLFLISILPMTLMQAASVSYDSAVMGIAFLFVALCLYLIHCNIKKVHLPILILLSFCLFYIKGGAYFPLVGLLLLVPLKKQFTPKQRILFWTIEIGVILLALTNQYGGNNASETMLNDTNKTYSLFYSIEHPLWFIKFFCHTLYTNFELYFKGLWGISIFGFHATTTPLLLCLPVFFILLTMSRHENTKMTMYVSDRTRMFIIICAICSVFMIGLGFVSVTKIGADVIYGIQGRYFIPLLLPFMLYKYDSVETEKSQAVKKDGENNLLYYMCVMDGYFVLYVLLKILGNSGM